jgi:hypothetical protein
MVGSLRMELLRSQWHPGLVLKQEGEIVATVSFAFDRSDRVTDIFIVRNPDKLAGLGDTSIH